MSRFRGGENDLRARTLEYSLAIIALVRKLRRRKDSIGWDISRQLIRSGTSIGANVYEADGAHSRADFVAKCTIALREAYETRYWLELAKRADLFDAGDSRLQQELTEIIAVLNAVISKSRSGVDHLRDAPYPFSLFAFCFLLSAFLWLAT